MWDIVWLMHFFWDRMTLYFIFRFYRCRFVIATREKREERREERNEDKRVKWGDNRNKDKEKWWVEDSAVEIKGWSRKRRREEEGQEKKGEKWKLLILQIMRTTYKIKK